MRNPPGKQKQQLCLINIKKLLIYLTGILASNIVAPYEILMMSFYKSGEKLNRRPHGVTPG